MVGGDGSGRRRIEIEVLQAGRLARFGYDIMPDGTRTRQVAQLGENGAALLFKDGNASLPEPPKIDQTKTPLCKEPAGFKTLKVPAGTFRCRVIHSVQGEACINEGLMPLKIVKFTSNTKASMTLIGRGFDAKPGILAKPRPLPVLDSDKLPRTP